MDKRGQIFLLAAFIISGIFFILTNTVNKVQVNRPNDAFYELSEEIKFETKRVLDYGTFWDRDMNQLIIGFLNNYSDYISQEKVIFIFGNESIDGLRAMYFVNNILTGSVGVVTGARPVNVYIRDITNNLARVTRQQDIVNVEIDGVNYAFKLKEGQNFFFVMIKDEGEESFATFG